MTPESNPGEPGNHGLPIGMKVAAWGLALIVAGYGLVKAPELRVPVSEDAGTPVPVVPIPVPLAERDLPPHAAAQNGSRTKLDEIDK